MLKTELLLSNPCCRNQQTSISLQIRQSQTFSLTIDYQLIAIARIKKTVFICPHFTTQKHRFCALKVMFRGTKTYASGG